LWRRRLACHQRADDGRDNCPSENFVIRSSHFVLHLPARGIVLGIKRYQARSASESSTVNSQPCHQIRLLVLVSFLAFLPACPH
jgi:hypothetical protein